jgi:hypothetical protein
MNLLRSTLELSAGLKVEITPNLKEKSSKMAVLSSNRIAWTYTDDLGNNWRVAALKDWTTQAKLGGAAAAATVPQRPAGYKMRRVTVSDGAGHSRTVPVYAVGAPIATPGTTFNYNANVAGVITEVTGTSSGRVLPEGASRQNVTKQST